ncbi:hypothetical protein IMCC3317_34450 [Kordia antarctica]|uniref:Uncharacterized protein n=1 Tax=Kordia antarctica TaxID=1218801 RepID=A0A7L4ZNI0_9FLAO|nr:hypothetical protein IMCC3317_34450 [Kordia antarctica]
MPSYQHIRKTTIKYSDFHKTKPYGLLCAHERDTHRTLTLQTAHTDEVLDIPRKPMNKKEIEQFVQYLLVNLQD